MKLKRQHPKYYTILLFAQIEKLTINDIAIELNITKYKVWSKINGYDDFTPYEAIKLSNLLRRKQEEIFLT